MNRIYSVYFRWFIIFFPLIVIVAKDMSPRQIAFFIVLVFIFLSMFPDFMTDREENLYIHRFIKWKRIEWSRLVCAYNLVIDRMYFLRNERGGINFLSLFILQPIFVRKGVKLAQLFDCKLAGGQVNDSDRENGWEGPSGDLGFKWNTTIFKINAQRLLLIILAILGAIFVGALLLVNSPRIPSDISNIGKLAAFIAAFLFMGVFYSLVLIWIVARFIEIKRNRRNK